MVGVLSLRSAVGFQAVSVTMRRVDEGWLVWVSLNLLCESGNRVIDGSCDRRYTRTCRSSLLPIRRSLPAEKAIAEVKRAGAHRDKVGRKPRAYRVASGMVAG